MTLFSRRAASGLAAAAGCVMTTNNRKAIARKPTIFLTFTVNHRSNEVCRTELVGS